MKNIHNKIRKRNHNHLSEGLKKINGRNRRNRN